MQRLLLALLPFAFLPLAASAEDLPSWSETATRSQLVAFVKRVTDSRSPGFVPEAERIAVFDNDGTLWSEMPFYFQLFFVLDRLEELAPEHPEWADTEPFRSALARDFEALAAQGKRGLVELLMVTHAGMTTEEFAGLAETWVRTAEHPRSDRPFVEMVYQPMLELLAYLRKNGFKTYIVSGGGIEFMRPWAEDVYGIPPEQVVGSSIRTEFEQREDGPVLVRLPEVDFIDDKAGKPVGINRHIGRRPILAFGNSDGDLQMLQWTTAGEGPRLAALIHHTDADREWAYDRESHVGRLDQALTEARERGWLVVDMKSDWKQIHPDP